jgi:SUKH-4 immunity protein
MGSRRTASFGGESAVFWSGIGIRIAGDSSMRRFVGVVFYLLAIIFFIDAILRTYVEGFRPAQLPSYVLGVIFLAIGSTLIRRRTSQAEASNGPGGKPADFETVQAEVAAKLPAKCELLLLSFYGREAAERGDMIVIGEDDRNKLCVYKRDGHVCSVDESGELPSRFVNSSIDQLSQFLTEFERTVNRPKAASDEEREQRAQALRERLQAIDSGALDSPATWWSAVLEELEDGRR